MNPAPQYDVRRLISRCWMRPEFKEPHAEEAGCLDAPHAIPCGSVEAAMVYEHRTMFASHLWRV